MSRRITAALALLACGFATAGGAGGGVSASDSTMRLPALWGVELNARGARAVSLPRLVALRKAGINALFADPRRVRPNTLGGLRRRAARARLRVFTRRALRRQGVVVRRVAGANAAARRRPGRRTLVIARVAPSPRISPQPWRLAIAAARARAKLDLVVGPVGPRSAALDAYIALLTEVSSTSPPPPPPGPPAHWWPPPPAPIPDRPASVWVSTIGNDTTCARLDPSRPCQTFSRAYRLAQPGEQVEVAGGTYPRQTVPIDSTKTSEADVVLRPAPGATVTLGCQADLSDCIEVEGDHVTVKNMRMADFPPLAGMPRQGGVCICRGSDDVTFYNLDAGYVFIAGDNARVIGGDYGPVVDQVSKIEVNEGGRPPKNILVDGTYVHDHRGHARHPECWALYAGENVTIRNSRLNNCEVFGMFLAPGETTATNWLIENNFFANTGSVPMSAHLKTRSNGTCHNILIRHNTFVGEDVISECPGSNTRWESNIFSRLGGCVSVGTMDYNVVRSGSKCGPHDLMASTLGFLNEAAIDFHLLPTSPALGRGNPTSPTTRDIDGDSRPAPAGSAPDAGADER